MRFKVIQGFLQETWAFSKEANSSVTKMTEKASNFPCGMTMINMQRSVLYRSNFHWFIIANKTSMLLDKFKSFIFFNINPIPPKHCMAFLVLFKSYLVFRVLSDFLISYVMTFFAYIKSSIRIKIFMEFSKRFYLFTQNARLACF